MKRIGKIFLSALIVLLLLSAAYAENEASESGNRTTAVFYVAAAQDETVLDTAWHVVRSIAARGESPRLQVSRPDIKTVYDKLDEKTRKEVFKKDRKTGNEEFNSSNQIKKQIQKKAYDFWFIVPEQAAKSFVANNSVIEMMKANRQSRAHVVFIGDTLKKEDMDSSRMMREVPGISWICIKRDFTVSSLDEKENGHIHTGDYFIASLYGTPMELDVTFDEASGQWRFSVPENTRVLALVEGKNAENNEPQIVDLQGSIKSTEYISTGGGYSGAYTADSPLPAGQGNQYIIRVDHATGLYVKAYCYPKFDEIQPLMETAEEWERGEQTVSLKLGKMLGDPAAYSVQVRYREDDQEAVFQSMSYNAEQECWQTAFLIGGKVNSAALTPYVDLRMNDGNLAWSWSGEEVVREIHDREIMAKEEATKEATLYYYQDRYGNISGTWSDYFQYNPADYPEFGIKTDESAQASGWKATVIDGGFTLTYSPTDEAETRGCDVELTCGEVDHSMHIDLVDAETLLPENVLLFDQDNAPKKVGSDVSISAEVSKETADRWKEAFEQLGNALPGFDAMNLNAELRKDGEPDADPLKSVKPAALTEQEDGSWKAGCTIHLDSLLADGKYEITAQLADQDGIVSRELTQGVTVKNSKPYAVEHVENREFMLSGFPGGYTPKDLLTEVFPGVSLFDLFADDETAVRSVRLTVESVSGITVNGKTIDTAYDKVITAQSAPDQIQVTDTGEYSLTLTASDGVNDSEPIRISVKVGSALIRIAIYIGIGIAAALLVMVIVLIILQKRKPSFENISIRAYLSGDNSTEHGNEMLEKCLPIPMNRYQKQGIDLATIMLLARQPEVPDSVTETLADIIVYPSKYDEIRLDFGKKAMGKIGRQSAQERIQQGNSIRFRVENTYIQLENHR